jgi:hypothetical protein
MGKKNQYTIKPGEVRNPNGRPKGTPNKTTAEMKMIISDVVSKNLEKLEEDFLKVSPATRISLLEKWAKYVIPTLSQQDVSQVIDGKINVNITFEEKKEE